MAELKSAIQDIQKSASLSTGLPSLPSGAASVFPSPSGSATPIRPQSLPFFPRFFTVKGFCVWDRRLEDGVEEDAIAAWLKEAKKALPAPLRNQIAGHVARSWKAYSFEVWMHSSKATLYVMWHLIRASRAETEAAKVLYLGGKTPSFAKEASSEEEPRLKQMVSA